MPLKNTALAALPDQTAGISAAALALFGGPQGPNRASAALPETALQLTLKGALLRLGTDRKVAVIQSRHNEKSYRIGDRIEDAEIVGIEARRVILLRNGRRETLSLPVAELPARSRDSGAVSPLTRIDATADERIVTREQVARELENLPALLRQAKTVPYTNESGEPAGFRVVDLASDGVFADLGLRREDVIVAVNGMAVRNNLDALAAFRKFRSAEAVQLGLLRDGREVTVDFSIR